MASPIGTLILAAGLGKRMESKMPKVLLPLCGAPMIHYPVQAAQGLKTRPIVVVTGPDSKPVESALNGAHVKFVVQKERLGTGHAVLQAKKILNGFPGYLLILYGDVPLIQTETLKKFIQRVSEARATMGFISMEMDHPKGYGRVVRDLSGQIAAIVEEKEASPEIRQIREVNTGIYLVKAPWLFENLKRSKRHLENGEYYLTDMISLALAQNELVLVMQASSPDEFLGINNPAEWEEANRQMRLRLVDFWMQRGVRFVDSNQVYLDAHCTIGREVLIYPQVYLSGATQIGKNSIIETGAVLHNVRVGAHCHVKPYCVIEGSLLSEGAQVGPFARLRPGTKVGRYAKVGNFVELKKTSLGDRAKANHLTYLGDATVGPQANIGCGTITCNYDGVKKHPTKIGAKAFVGSDVQFVAPVTIGKGAYIGAGSTITENVPPYALALARSKQIVKRDWVKRRRK